MARTLRYKEQSIRWGSTLRQARAFSRLTSVAVILALLALTVVAVCCVAMAAPVNGGTPVGSAACELDTQGTISLVAEAPTLPLLLSAMLAVGIGLAVRAFGSVPTLAMAELPSSGDPRHGRTRV